MTISRITWKDFPKEQQSWIKSIDEKIQQERIEDEIKHCKGQLDIWKTSNKPLWQIDRAIKLIEKRLKKLNKTLDNTA